MTWPIRATLIASVLLASGCEALSGANEKPPKAAVEFCDAARPLLYDTVEVADYVTENDPQLADGISAHNIIGREECGWQFGSS